MVITSYKDLHGLVFWNCIPDEHSVVSISIDTLN